MATHTELFELYADSVLRNRVEVALILAAEGVRTEDPATPNHAARLAWAREVFANPQTWLMPTFRLLLAANQGEEAAQIAAVSDAPLVGKVAEAVDFFAPEVGSGQ